MSGNIPDPLPYSMTIDKPIMGGLTICPTEIVAWTGGQPNIDWTGLTNVKAIKRSPNCSRPTKSSDQSRNWNYRTAPPLILFKKDGKDLDLYSYGVKVLAHLELTGMDSIMYVKSLSDGTNMVNVIKDFEQVTLSHVLDESEYYKNKFDSYDQDNDTTARLYLESTLDPSLLKELDLRQEPGDSAAVTWMRILRLVSSGSVERFNRKKDELKQLSPIKEPGESVSLYANKIRRICRELENAHQFEWVLVLAIIKALCQVSVESFRAIWHPKRLDLDSALSDSAYLSKDSSKKFMVKKGFHYIAILDLAEEAYRSLLDNGDWSPASTVKDMQQAPSLFYAGMDQASFNALVQAAITAKPCGDVPVPPPKPTDPKKHNWREVAPKPGDPTVKVVGDKTFNFCNKCRKGLGLWTSTHLGSTHGKPPNAVVPASPAAPTPAPAIEAPVISANLAGVNDGFGICATQF